MLTAQPSTYDMFLFQSIYISKYEISRQHNHSFSKIQTCHMLMAQPSTYDMFALIELYSRKLQNEYIFEMIMMIVIRGIQRMDTY